MSSHSYEARLHDLEKELDRTQQQRPPVKKEKSDDVVKKKDNFVRVVGFATPPQESALIQRERSAGVASSKEDDSALAARPASAPAVSSSATTTQPTATAGSAPKDGPKETHTAPVGPSPVPEARADVEPVTKTEASETKGQKAEKQGQQGDKQPQQGDKQPQQAKAQKKPKPEQPRPDGVPQANQRKQSEMTKAERRELQEKQRAAKAQGQKAHPAVAAAGAAAKAPAPAASKPAAPPAARPATSAPAGAHSMSKAPLQYDDASRAHKANKKKILSLLPAQKQVPLFAHLPQYERNSSQALDVGFSTHEIHPSIISLGLKYADGTIRGGNARCVAMLVAFKDVIRDYVTPPEKVLARVLDSAIKPLIQFLVDCRPISVSMANAINYLKLEITATAQMGEADAKKQLYEKIDSYIEQRVLLADEVITTYGVSKINNGDVILTYACSYVVELILKKAYDLKKRFRVVIVDSRPHNEGKELLKRLVRYGVECTYILIPAVSYIMKEVDKVFVGAAAMMNNGGLLSRVGTAVIAMMAHAYHIPFLVCCETYKFCERVQLDSICSNELGNPDELRTTPGTDEANAVLRDWKSMDKLRLLNLKYDVAPPQLITLVISEVGMIPPTSVPVVIREYHTEPPSYLE